MGANETQLKPTVEEAKKDARAISDESVSSMEKASQTLIREVVDFDNKNKQNPEARIAYHETLNKELENRKLIPSLSIEYLNTTKLVGDNGLSRQDLGSQIEEANTRGDMLRVKMLSTIMSNYDALKNKVDDKDGTGKGSNDVISKNDLEASRTKNSNVEEQPNLYQFTSENKSEDQKRADLAKQIDPKFNADGYLTKGQTLYDLAKNKLTVMNSVKPENERKSISNKEIFEECANIMNRSNDSGSFSKLDPVVAGQNMQRSIPKDWNALTSKTPLRLFTSEELSAIVKNNEAKKSSEKNSIVPTTVSDEKQNPDNKNKVPGEKPDFNETKDDFGNSTVVYTDTSTVVKDAKGRVTSLQDAKGAKFTFSYAGDEIVPIKLVNGSGAWTRTPGTDEWRNDEDKENKNPQKVKVSVSADTYSFKDESGNTTGFNRDGSSFVTTQNEKTNESKVTPNKSGQVEEVITENGWTYTAKYEGDDPQPVQVTKPGNEVWTRDTKTNEWSCNGSKFNGKLTLSLTKNGYSYTTETQTVSFNTDGTYTVKSLPAK